MIIARTTLTQTYVPALNTTSPIPGGSFTVDLSTQHTPTQTYIPDLTSTTGTSFTDGLSTYSSITTIPTGTPTDGIAMVQFTTPNATSTSSLSWNPIGQGLVIPVQCVSNGACSTFGSETIPMSYPSTVAAALITSPSSSKISTQPPMQPIHPTPPAALITAAVPSTPSNIVTTIVQTTHGDGVVVTTSSASAPTFTNGPFTALPQTSNSTITLSSPLTPNSASRGYQTGMLITLFGLFVFATLTTVA